ncbi:hypothetical protein LTS08_003577 [Lithohypha guttulata]|nr:hypothetical protein LTS08_003577 [Lithohypha guttulata]
MGDPLSVAASVAGLVSLGLQTTEYLYKYYAAYKDREEDLAKTTNRLSDLLQTLGVIDEVLRLRKWRSDEQTTLQNIENAIYRSEDVIQDLQEEVRKFQKEPTTNVTTAIRAAGRRAAYPFRKGTLAKLDEDVGAFRENLSIALQALQLKEHQNTQNDIEEVKHIVKSAQAQHLAAGVRQWLRAPDATVDYNAACAKRHAGTGRWFVQGPSFTAWLQRDNSFFWLYGFAGCGKSVLCSTAIQHAFRQQRARPGSAIAFFFFTFNDESKRDVSALLRALLLQLSGQIAGVEADLAKLQDSINHGTPAVPVLMEHLRQAVTRSRHVYILLDALDECPAGNVRRDVLAMIQTMRQWSLPGLHLLVTSRDTPDIRDHLYSQDQTQDREYVALSDHNVRQDIHDYLIHHVDHDPGLRRWGDHRGKIKDYLAQHANGVFRWVDCQLQSLRDCPRSVRHLEKRLRDLPPSLDETYERMLCNIDAASQDDAQRILALLCCSTRPLSVNELIDALAIDLEGDKGFDADRRFEGTDDLLCICPGMIEVHLTTRQTDSSFSDDDTPAQAVRIAHFSVQEYLVSDRIKQGRAARFAISAAVEHARISQTCLLYLSNDEFLEQAVTRDLVEQYPFARFAARYWYQHYRQADAEFATHLSLKVTMFLRERTMLDRWIMLHDPERPWRTKIDYGASAKDRASATYFTALLGLEDVLAHILSVSRADVNAQEGEYGNALQAASSYGHERVVQILLEKGADVNAQGGRYGNALQAASEGDHERVVQILLEKGADVNAQGGTYSNALEAASEEGHEAVVQMLLNAGAIEYYYEEEEEEEEEEALRNLNE